MKRPIPITITATVVLLLGLLELGLAALSTLGVLVDLKGGINFGPHPVGWLNKTFLAAAICCILLGAWHIVTSEALFNLPPWARLSMTCLGVIYALLGTWITVSGFFAEMQTPLARSAQSAFVYAILLTAKLGWTWCYLAMIAFGTWCLKYFRSNDAKAAFAAE